MLARPESPSTSHSWRDAEAKYAQYTLFVQCHSDSCSIHWLHVAEGFQTFCRAGTLTEVVATWVTWIQLEFFGVLPDFYMHEDLLQSQGDALLCLHNSLYQNHQFVSSFNNVSDSVARKKILTPKPSIPEPLNPKP